jgi:hypothetical protein
MNGLWISSIFLNTCTQSFGHIEGKVLLKLVATIRLSHLGRIPISHSRTKNQAYSSEQLLTIGKVKPKVEQMF